MRRFFVSERLGATMALRGQDVRHITKVLRMGPGTDILVVDPDGQTGRATITAVGGETVTVALAERVECCCEPPIKVWLAQGLPKGDKMELVIQKAVEMGATGVIPMITEFCTVRYDAAKQLDRVTRWQKIAQEAAKQCGRNLVPAVSPIKSLAEVLAGVGDWGVIMLYEGEAETSLRTVLAANRVGSYLLLVGPEGGFSAAEAEFCRRHGGRTARLGPRILRTETAALASLAIVLYEYGDLGGR